MAEHFRINELLTQLAALTQQRDHYGAQCVALNTQLAEALAHVQEFRAQANTGPSKDTLQMMLDDANKSARLIDNQRVALVQELHGETSTHLNAKVVERDRHSAQSRGEIAQPKRENEELLGMLGEFIPGTRYTEPQVQDIRARPTHDFDGKLKTKQDEVDRHVAELGKLRSEGHTVQTWPSAPMPQASRPTSSAS